MNKHVVNALKQYEFTYDRNIGYGCINGYEVNVLANLVAWGPIFFFSTFLSQSKKNDFVIKLNAKKIPLVRTEAFDFGVVVMIGVMTAGSIEKKCGKVIPVILEILELLEAPKKDICPQSGEGIDEQNSKVTILPENKVKIRLSNNAILAVNSTIEKNNEDFQEAPNNYFRGFGGIFIGALTGLALTVIFALLGYITALAPLVSIIFGVYLYSKFGGKQNYVMIIMSFVTTLVVILGAITLMYIVAANKAVIKVGLDYRGFEALTYCLKAVPEFQRLFYLDLSLNAFFILLAEGFSIYRLIKMIQRPKGLK